MSDKGCVRENNEDMAVIGDDIFRDNSRKIEIDLAKNQKLFIAIADGMGGHNAGEVASRMALEKMAGKLASLEENLDEGQITEKIKDWVKEIHQEIINEGIKDINKRGMGSTLIGVLFYEGKVYYLNIGDSRLYRYRRGNLIQISKDHSLREATGDKNVAANVILNSLGGRERIFVDFAPVGGKILDGDLLLLCSDGLSDMLTDDEIEDILNNEKENPVSKLLDEAKNGGGKDNITIVLIQINEEISQIEG